jgi:hypothetical protein
MPRAGFETEIPVTAVTGMGLHKMDNEYILLYLNIVY